MEQEMEGTTDSVLSTTVERLAAAAEMLERAAEQLIAGQSGLLEQVQGARDEMQSTVERIVATTEKSEELTTLEDRLKAAMAEIAELRAQQETRGAERKTLPLAASGLLAKHGIAAGAEGDATALDAALASLSIEQRIAVKSQLLRAGLVG